MSAQASVFLVRLAKSEEVEGGESGWEQDIIPERDDEVFELVLTKVELQS